ncbi:uncharacterized protein N0V89_003294 [Didymosphaeria variabile]|uniref:Clavaminate synthase-like protein n=1 Tax=Didymosphaeria variabile TaxID=1932322 RepID=A0A9W8XVU1_9PLEO|nr:uncharacterized protein N0V89_003294 [Didymosphaeria variabile]KAJ4358710.1 hypothetical protein N0V89_003294 [Didymosphaeria variabile]
MAPTREELFTSFPDDVATAPLVTISLRKLDSDDAQEKERLFEASKSLGFFYLDMRDCAHGEALLKGSDDMFDLNEKFYDLPLEEKTKYDFAAKGMYFGYKGMGAEVIDGKGTKDKNEIYNISKDDILSISDPLPAPALITNNRPNLASYIYANNAVLTTLFTSLAASLQLPPSAFSLTILFNRVGGLQVLLPNTSDWVYVRPMPGCAIINLGDAMVKFSAGILRSNMHRVVAPPGTQENLVRYSLVYFSRPEYDVKMKRIEGGLVGRVANDGEVEDESTREWLKRRHQGRKVQFFKGAESWEGAMGTEAKPQIAA